VSYRYDPFGRRIARILGNITELTLYDGWNPVAEYANTPQSPTISLNRTFVWGLDVSGSLQGAGGVGGLLAIREAAGNGSSKAGQAIFPAYDGNGNIIRLTDSNGATVASYAYDGFGNRINPAASDIDSSGYANENRYGFSTKPRDPLTGLLYYGYRWYDPATGRWASRDPIEESGGVNLYGFVGNDNVNGADYLGLTGWGLHAPSGKQLPTNITRSPDETDLMVLTITVMVLTPVDETVLICKGGQYVWQTVTKLKWVQRIIKIRRNSRFEKAVDRLDEKGVKPSADQKNIDPDRANDLADKMIDGKWDDATEGSDRMLDFTKESGETVIGSGHHRTVAEEIAKGAGKSPNLPREQIPVGPSFPSREWVDLPRNPGSR
jgi:RHS repeat-associated protein